MLKIVKNIKCMLQALVILTALFSSAYNQTKHITLDANNTVLLKGGVTTESVSFVVKTIISKNPEYLVIDSFGGSIQAGNYLVETLKTRKMKCIAAKAYSMAFVILQACSERYVLSTSTLMQHQASLRVHNELTQLKEYVSMVSAMEDYLNELQSQRIGMKKEAFTQRVLTEWWLFGRDIVKYNCADAIVSISCSKSLLNTKVIIREKLIFGDVTYTYSACPLVPDTI